MSEVPQSWGEPRSRVVTWYDPRVTAEHAAAMPGLDFMQAVIAGEVPGAPIGALMGFAGGSAEAGRVTFLCTPDESVYNPIGIVHGGLVCTLLDSALGCAVHTTLPAGSAYTSLELKVSYLRPVTRDSGQLVTVGTVTKPGRRAAFAEGTVHDAAGRLVATASSTLLIFPVT